MGDGNKAGDPKSSNGGSSDDGGGGSGSTNPPDLGNADRLGSMESIGDGGRGGGKSRGLANGYANLHGSSESEYPHGSSNGYANLHEIGGGGSSSSGYPHGLANGYGSGHQNGFVNGYANLHQIGGSGSTVPFNPHYGNPDITQLNGGGSRSVHQRAPGNLSINLYNNIYGGARVWPQQAPMTNSYAAVPRFLPNGNGVISRPPQRPGSHDLDAAALLSDRLGSLTIGNGYAGRRNTFAEFPNQRQRQDRRIAGNTVPANIHGVYAGNPYWRMTLEGLKGSVSRVARNLHGRQFLCRMVRERREEAVHYVFDEVAGDIVRLMGHGVSAEFVDDMSTLWTDEQVLRVIQTLGASPPLEVMAAARNQSGSNVLQNLISRIDGRRQEIECFVRSLASVGELNLLALMKDQAGSRVIQKCLETFSPEHNLFVVWVVMHKPHEVAYNKHGCHTMKSCIDNSIDARTRDYLVLAVCADGLGLAQNQFGNYVVQHVIRAVPRVPWAMEMLHAGFQGKYLCLSQQKASSNVVQACLVFFPQALSYEIVWELLSHDNFSDLIQDPFANYVLQSAVATTQVLIV
ncbi:hypothetical protein ACQ4PT_022342 [Festuca glaucescens]